MAGGGGEEETGGSAGRRRRTERWFVHQGLPHFIADYSVTGDVLTRALPFLSLVFVLEAFNTFSDDREGVAEVGPFFVGVAVAVSYTHLDVYKRQAPAAVPTSTRTN